MKKIGLSLLCASTMFTGAAFAQGGDGQFSISAGDAKLNFSGSHRTRHEIKSPATYAGGGVDRTTSVTWMRTRFGVDVNLADDHNFMFEMQDIRSYGSEPTAAANTNDTLDVLQAYYYTSDFLGEGIELYAGRQKFTIGNERLFSTLEWSQASRAWDGLRVHKNMDAWSMTAFALVIDDAAFASDDRYNFGAVIGYNGVENHEIEGVVIHDLRQGNGNGDGDTTNLSLRVDGSQMDGDLSYSVEGVYQIGTIEGATDIDVSAFGLFGSLTYHHALEGGAMLHFTAGYEYTSGDDDATDNEVNTFFAPYPYGHKYNGYADIVGYSNLQDVNLTIVYDSGKAWNVEVAGHIFSRADDNDGLYDSTGALLRAGTSADGTSIGGELDVVFNYSLAKFADLQFGWAHFFAGEFIDDTTAAGGVDDDIDFFWGSLSLKF